jgi:glycosyltransferase involved in cell wall biosynthesis
MTQTTGPTFSIITPSFRMLDWLKLCVASVADQEGVAVEHIVQDGGTGLELDIWAAAQQSAKVFQERDSGMYDAINRGLKRATGQLFAYLNCDEQYLPGALAKVQTYFDEHPGVDVLFGDAILVDRKGCPLSYRRMVRPHRVHLRLAHLPTLSCATFFRRRLVERGLIFDGRLGSVGDAVWINSLLEARVPMACFHEPLAIYTFTGANESETERPARELAAWRREVGGPPLWLRAPAIAIHRLEKLVAGAYRKRNVSYSIYTLSVPEKRMRFDAPALHYGWPGATAPPADGCQNYRGANRSGSSNVAT